MNLQHSEQTGNPQSSPHQLSSQQLSCQRGERLLFADLSFTLHPGEALRVLGANGSGKTSLLRMVCALLPPTTGSVNWNDCPVTQCRPQFHSQLLYLGHADGVNADLSALENLQFAAALAQLSCDTDAAIAALASVGLLAVSDLAAKHLSAGQRKRLQLARLALADASSHPLWVLDEPFSALDQAATANLCTLLAQHLDNGGMLLYSTHQEVDFARQRQRSIVLSATPVEHPC